MKFTYTYKGQSDRFKRDLELCFLFIKLTLKTQGERIGSFFPLIIASYIFNLITWPLVLIFALDGLGMQIAYSFKNWLSVAIIIFSLQHFWDKRNE